jgi:DNA/RNA-binding protein KIN17
MPKAERGTPKDLANRIKAKGLQKLKFYCQMCQKQCRDANGFKCHLTSESHLRQMKLFSDNAGGILDKYSKDFERSYLQALRTRHGTKLVNANNVYQELIADRQHIHMNATHWTTLTEFVQYLGRSGTCVVEETDRGWFVGYVERDSGILARKEAVQRREEAERAAEEARAKQMEVQRVEAAKALERVVGGASGGASGGALTVEATAMERREGDDHRPVRVTLTAAASKASGGGLGAGPLAKRVKASGFFGEDDEQDGEDAQLQNAKIPPSPLILPPSKLGPKTSMTAQGTAPTNDFNRKRKDLGRADAAEVGPNQSKRSKHGLKSNRDDDRSTNVDEAKNPRDYWLYRNIVVRVVSKQLAGGKYFRRKAVVDKVIDKYVAEVEVLDSSPDKRDGGDILRLDQHDLETVIPKMEQGKSPKVRILNGHYRGEKAIIDFLDKKKYQADLKLLEDGKLLKNVPFEDFSQVA